LLLARRLFTSFGAQSFIARRGAARWAAHWLISWGCVLAALVTFPLSFGWIRFETLRDSQEIYQAFVFGLLVFRFPLGSPRSRTFVPRPFADLAAAAPAAEVGSWPAHTASKPTRRLRSHR
jgi:hypothetical protein